MTQTTEYRSNNERTETTPAARFLMSQRHAGYADNDGRWVVSQLPELYWSAAGVLRQRRPGAFLGVFDTEAAALATIQAAEPQPERDEWVESMGSASC
jgi:hypothetical protein